MAGMNRGDESSLFVATSRRLWDARQEADEALATFPRDSDLNVARARLMALRGDVAEAESCLIRQVRDGGDERSRKALEGLRAALEVIRRDTRDE